MSQKELEFNGHQIVRKFNKEWVTSGAINLNKLPQLVECVLEHNRQMVDYIEALHDKIDYLLEHNNCCDVPGCHTAGCTSDHK